MTSAVVALCTWTAVFFGLGALTGAWFSSMTAKSAKKTPTIYDVPKLYEYMIQLKRAVSDLKGFDRKSLRKWLERLDSVMAYAENTENYAAAYDMMMELRGKLRLALDSGFPHNERGLFRKA